MLGGRVLVADGDAVTAGSLRWLLREHGYTVASPASPDAILSAVDRFAPDILIADAEAIEWARLASELNGSGRRSDIRLIAAGGSGDILDNGDSHAPDAHVHKPYQADEVLASVTAQYRVCQELRLLRSELARAAEELAQLREASATSRQLVDILSEITGEVSASEIYRVLTRRVARSLEINSCSVVLARLGDVSGTMVAAFEDPSVTDLAINMADYPEVAVALQSDHPVIIEDASRHPLLESARERGDPGERIARARSIVALPFSIDRSNTGVLLMRTNQDSRTLDPGDAEFAEAVVKAAVAAIRRAQALESTRADNLRLEALATTDALTRVLNRRALLDRLESEVDRARRYGSFVTMLLLDVDHFKRINDTAGHLAGDDVLRQIATLLEEAIRRVDIVARYGGEEFVLILPETAIEGALVFSERLRERIAAHGFVLGDANPVHLTVSIGVATFPGPRVDSTEDLFARADEALYRAKSEGRNKVRS